MPFDKMKKVKESSQSPKVGTLNKPEIVGKTLVVLIE
jgi:hypothetical protein